jgi:hypothetical protein
VAKESGYDGGYSSGRSGGYSGGESKRSMLLSRVKALRTERQSFESQWRDLSEYISPWTSRFNVSDRNRGDKRGTKILDNTATQALGVLSAGMMSGITSPARPWFHLSHADPDLAEFAPVKRWLNAVSDRMRMVLSTSNFYLEIANLYPQVALYGTAAMSELEHPTKAAWFKTYPIGSYMIAVDSDGRPNTFARESSMTVGQLVGMFGIENVSRPVRELWERNSLEDWIEVVQLIEPNPEADRYKLESKYKRWRSCYFEPAGDSDKLLREAGFDTFPIMAPRWNVNGEDVYGTGPGWYILPEVKSLQVYEKLSSKAVAKSVDPPMVGPSSLRNEAATLVPGGITYVDSPNGTQAFRPAHEVNLRVDMLDAKQNDIRTRIMKGLFNDLFMMMANDTRTQPVTAREIAERHEEKLTVLGPVLERLNTDLFDPVVDRTFELMLKANMVPPPPPELQGQALHVEYISIMAQAMKMVSTGGVERLTQFVGGVGAVVPEALDKINVDATIDTYADMMGVPPKIVRTDDEVAQIRQVRAQQQQAMMQAQHAQQMAETGKTLSETNTSGDNAMAAVLRQAGAA